MAGRSGACSHRSAPGRHGAGARNARSIAVRLRLEAAIQFRLGGFQIGDDLVIGAAQARDVNSVDMYQAKQLKNGLGHAATALVTGAATLRHTDHSPELLLIEPEPATDLARIGQFVLRLHTFLVTKESHPWQGAFHEIASTATGDTALRDSGVVAYGPDISLFVMAQELFHGAARSTSGHVAIGMIASCHFDESNLQRAFHRNAVNYAKLTMDYSGVLRARHAGLPRKGWFDPLSGAAL